MASKNVELFTIRGRFRLLEARKKVTKLNDCMVCEEGFMHSEGFSFSDATMLIELTAFKIDISTALQTPVHDEDRIIKEKFTALAAAST